MRALIPLRPTPPLDASLSLRRLCDLRRRYVAEHDALLCLLEQAHDDLERCLTTRRQLRVEGATSSTLDERCAMAQADVMFLEKDLFDLRCALVGLDDEIEAAQEQEAEETRSRLGLG